MVMNCKTTYWKQRLASWVTIMRTEHHPKARNTLTFPSSDHCLKAHILHILPVDLSGAAIFDDSWQSKRRSASKNGHILTLDNRCCHSKPIIVSIMKSVEQKRGTLSFPYAGPCVLYIPLFIRSWLLITVPFASESRIPYNLHPKNTTPMQMKWPKKSVYCI